MSNDMRQGVRLTSQYLKDFSFQCPDMPGLVFGGASGGPEVQVNVDVEASRLDERRYEVGLRISAEATIGGKSAYSAELLYGGTTEVPEDYTEEQRENLLLVDAAEALFPFARQILSTAAQEGGFPALSLRPIDFRRLLEDRRAAGG